MNKIKKIYHLLQLRFGNISVAKLEHLCTIYIVHHEPETTAAWFSLYSWRKLTKEDSVDLFEQFLHYHTADEGLFKSEWLLRHEYIRNAYFRSLCSRKIKPTRAEEKWILESGEAGAMRCLKYPLSDEGEAELLACGNPRMIYNYVICHLLSDAGEAALANLAAEQRDVETAYEYRQALQKYFEMHHDMRKEKVFTSLEAQTALFTDNRNDELIMSVIRQCNMYDFLLNAEIIRMLAYHLPERYLAEYLACSYIADRDLVAELQTGEISEHLRDMVSISERRRVIHEILLGSLLLISDDWHDDEYDLFYHRLLYAEDDGNLETDLAEYVQPRIQHGAVSPAMSAAVAARFPKLAKDMLLNLTRYEDFLQNKILLVNPLDMHHVEVLRY